MPMGVSALPIHLLPEDVARALVRKGAAALPRLTFPPMIPADDPLKLWWYITDRWSKGETGLPDVFEVEKMGYSRDAYVKTFQSKWEKWNQNLRGAIQDKDLEKITRLYMTLYAVYSAALSYGALGVYRLPQHEYEDAVKAISKDKDWYGNGLSDLGIELHPDTLYTLLRGFLQEDEKRKRNWSYGNVSFYEVVQARWWGMASDSWKDVWASVFMIPRDEGTGIYVTLFMDSSLRVIRAPHGIASTPPNVQERYNEGANGVYVDGYTGYKLPRASLLRPDLLVTPLINAYKETGRFVGKLESKGYRQARAGEPQEGSKKFRFYKEPPPRLMWIASDEELDIRVVNDEKDLRLDVRGKPLFEKFLDSAEKAPPKAKRADGGDSKPEDTVDPFQKAMEASRWIDQHSYEDPERSVHMAHLYSALMAMIKEEAEAEADWEVLISTPGTVRYRVMDQFEEAQQSDYSAWIAVNDLKNRAYNYEEATIAIGKKKKARQGRLSKAAHTITDPMYPSLISKRHELKRQLAEAKRVARAHPNFRKMGGLWVMGETGSISQRLRAVEKEIEAIESKTPTESSYFVGDQIRYKQTSAIFKKGWRGTVRRIIDDLLYVDWFDQYGGLRYEDEPTRLDDVTRA